MGDETDAPERLAPDPARIADAGEFARELTLARQHAGLTVRQVQKATGMVTSTLGGYFAGRHSPNPDALDLILRACGIDERAVVRQWHEALGRVRKELPGRRRPRTLEPPYRGLESFRPEDAPWFFGRGALVDAVVAAVRERAGRGPLVVVGASGAGKSSLLRAGVVAAFTRGTPNSRSPALLTPGEAPLAALATRLHAVARHGRGRAAGRPGRWGSGRHRCAAPRVHQPVRGGLRPGRRRGRARSVHPGAVRARHAGRDRAARRLLRPRSGVRRARPRRPGGAGGRRPDERRGPAFRRRRTRAQGGGDGRGRPGRGSARRRAPARGRSRCGRPAAPAVARVAGDLAARGRAYG